MFWESAFTLNPTFIKTLKTNPQHHLLQCRGPCKEEPVNNLQPTGVLCQSTFRPVHFRLVDGEIAELLCPTFVT